MGGLKHSSCQKTLRDLTLFSLDMEGYGRHWEKASRYYKEVIKGQGQVLLTDVWQEDDRKWA